MIEPTLEAVRKAAQSANEASIRRVSADFRSQIMDMIYAPDRLDLPKSKKLEALNERRAGEALIDFFVAHYLKTHDAEARIAELEAALAPFAKAARHYDDENGKDDRPAHGVGEIRRSHLRHARAALSRDGDADG